mmetsp:Transcript_13965/g.18126  ORF Transcript_13965/g.18126 Transcript_13965/m.18126 type:complete len:249 (+) Transcript_13965:180-926(+)
MSGSFSVPLPEEYALLERFFSSLESTVPFLCQRKSSVPFSAIKAAVEPNVKKTFTEEHLGKILFIFPNALKVSRDQDGKLFIQMPHTIIGSNVVSIAEASQKRRTTFRENLVVILEKRQKVVARKMPGKGKTLPLPLEKSDPILDVENQPSCNNNNKSLIDSSVNRVREIYSGGSQMKRKFIDPSNEPISVIAQSPLKSSNCLNTTTTTTTNANASNGKKRRNAIVSGLKGLPNSLIEAVKQRQESES